MKAALMYGPGDIRVEEVERPACPEGGLILKVVSVGLCGSDIRNLTTDSRAGDYPWTYGHEIAGIVDEVSPSCTEYAVGDRLYVYPAGHCMECEACRRGHHEMCENLGKYGKRPGGFADYWAVHADHLATDAVFRLPEGASFDRATLAEPLSSVYGCQENIGVCTEDVVAILGAGPIGCYHAKIARMRGARKIILCEINPGRLEFARKLDVDAVIDCTEEDPVEAVLRLTDGKGAEKVISANPSLEAQQQAIFMARRNGIVVFFGGVEKGALTEIDTNRIHYFGLWIYGHYGATSMQVQRAFELALDDRFRADEIITQRMGLEQINDAIALARSGKAVKVILRPNGGGEEPR